MKKLLLGVVLLAALVGISYLKTTLESEQAAEAFIDGHRVGAKAAQSALPDPDSISGAFEQERQALVDKNQALNDSLAAREQEHAQVVDSLSDRLVSQQDQIEKLRKEVASKPATSTQQPSKTTAAKSTESQIVNHYKLAVAKLPSDLSAYEYRVALAEVKAETAEKFKITVDRLDQIRKAHNLE